MLVVHEKAIREHPDAVQKMVDGIAKSGKWLEGSMEHRMSAAEAVAKNYYNQHPKLLRYVLSTPPDRVTYANLALARKDFEFIEKLALEAGILNGSVTFDSYADTRFSDKTKDATAYQWEGQ